MIRKQTFFPRNIAARDISLISTLGERSPRSDGEDPVSSWRRHVTQYETFSLVAGENCFAGTGAVFYTKWEDYIKVNFFLGGKQATVLDGFGEYELDRPQVFIVSGPRDMMKVDLVRPGAPTAGVALCLRRDFFPVHLGLDWDELPRPLRDLVLPDDRPYGFHQLPLTRDLVAAARGILNAPFRVRCEPAYGQAKTIELMCLLLDQMSSASGPPRISGKARTRHDSRLQDARELLARRYSEPLTLEQICRQVGLNRNALTSGFRQRFGISVHDCLTKERMEHAYELLQDEAYTIGQVAQAVGYGHACTFSTAFHAYFGCSPQKARTQHH